jgi:hypothetical protein
MLKLLLPISGRGMDWMYAYDPRRARDLSTPSPRSCGVETSEARS